MPPQKLVGTFKGEMHCAGSPFVDSVCMDQSMATSRRGSRCCSPQHLVHIHESEHQDFHCPDNVKDEKG